MWIPALTRLVPTASFHVRVFSCVLVLSGCLCVTLPARAAQRVVAPCAVLTNAEVEQAIGRLNRPPRPSQEGGVSWCGYESANGTGAMEVWVFPADGLDRARKLAKKPVPISGLGEGALMERNAHGLGYLDLYVRKGTVTLKLAIKETGGDERTLRTLAEKALGRI